LPSFEFQDAHDLVDDITDIDILIHNSEIFIEVHLSVVQDIIYQVKEVISTLIRRKYVFIIEFLSNSLGLFSTRKQDHKTI